MQETKKSAEVWRSSIVFNCEFAHYYQYEDTNFNFEVMYGTVLVGVKFVFCAMLVDTVKFVAVDADSISLEL